MCKRTHSIQAQLAAAAQVRAHEMALKAERALVVLERKRDQAAYENLVFRIREHFLGEENTFYSKWTHSIARDIEANATKLPMKTWSLV